MAHAGGRGRTAAMVAAAVAVALCALAPAAAGAKGRRAGPDDLAVQAGPGERPLRGLAVDDADSTTGVPQPPVTVSEATRQAGLLLRLPDGERPAGCRSPPGRSIPRCGRSRCIRPRGTRGTAASTRRCTASSRAVADQRGITAATARKAYADVRDARGRSTWAVQPRAAGSCSSGTPRARSSCASWSRTRGRRQARGAQRLVSAILLGGNVVVKKGAGPRRRLQHVPACRSGTQLGCVVAFSTFGEPPPANPRSAGRRASRRRSAGPRSSRCSARTRPPSGGGSARSRRSSRARRSRPGRPTAAAPRGRGSRRPWRTRLDRRRPAPTRRGASRRTARTCSQSRPVAGAPKLPGARRQVGPAPQRREHRAGQPRRPRPQAGRAVREARLVRPRRAAAGARAPAAGAGGPGSTGAIACATGAPGSSATCSP